jgi:hypothetical protein
LRATSTAPAGLTICWRRYSRAIEMRTYLTFGDIEGKLDVLWVKCTRCDRKT